MNGRKKRIRILDLQDQNCRKCECNRKPLKNCTLHCEVGKELADLGKELFTDSSIRRKHSEEHWERICQQAAVLQEKGMGYTTIAARLKCHPSGLREQLKKRDLWRGESMKEIQENSREKWNRVCQQAVLWRKEGYTYMAIARRLGCHVTSLRVELKKRGLQG
ncbi:hypothetical protein [Bacillus wiedmannii]|uniref:hypothetical protein n=1 Tax=Bacillus wiedmannii TaxID=1890302 RepID=UPI000BF0F5CF|nr:hypothetical protein [Bacillus wiedmannii]PEO37650.1 hypothetical protein CN555_17070 [Bacillus wiedmannii]